MVVLIILVAGAVGLAVYFTLEMPEAEYRSSRVHRSTMEYDENNPGQSRSVILMDVVIRLRNNNWFRLKAENLRMNAHYPSKSSTDPKGFHVGTIQDRPDTLFVEAYETKDVTLDGRLYPLFEGADDVASEWRHAAESGKGIPLKFDGHVEIFTFQVPISFDGTFDLAMPDTDPPLQPGEGGAVSK